MVIGKIKTFFKLLVRNPKRLFVTFAKYEVFNWMSDKAFLRHAYEAETMRKLNLENPILFAEKLQWLKLHDRCDFYVDYVDKYKMREIIEEKYGKEYLIPLIGVYDSENSIPWDELPEQFVIKCSHGSGCNVICKDKKNLDIEKTKKQLHDWMNKNWYYYGREWPYKNIKPRIVIEKFVKDDSQKDDLTDYKFYCFEGVPTYCQVIGDRHDEKGESVYYIDFYDRNWNKTEFTGFHAPGKPFPHRPYNVPKPKSYDDMVKIANELSAGTHYVRVDFYEINGEAKFGEFTLYPMSGFGEFFPEEWNERLGSFINIDRGVI